MELKLIKTIDLPFWLSSTDFSFDDLGGSLVGVRSDDDMCVVDVESGNLLFTVDECSNCLTGSSVGDVNAIYIARDYMVAENHMTAHDRKTGAEIWRCELAKVTHNFYGPLVQDDKYIYYINHKSFIIMVDKANGKVVNKFDVQDKDIAKRRCYIIPWQGKVLYSRVIMDGKGKNKKYSLALSLYDPLSKGNEHIGDILIIEGATDALKARLFGDMLFYMPDDGVFRVIDLNTKEMVFEHDFIPDGDQTISGGRCGLGYWGGFVSDFVKDGDKVHFMVQTEDDNKIVNQRYVTERYFATLDATSWKIEVQKEPYDENNLYYCYYDGTHSFRAGDVLIVNKPTLDPENQIHCGGRINQFDVINGKMCVVAENGKNDRSRVFVFAM